MKEEHLAGKRKKVSITTSRPAFNAAGKTVCIFGESPLVEEYAVRCLGRGFTVHVRFNPGPNGKKGDAGLVPKGAKPIKKAEPEPYCALELTNTSREAKRRNLAELDRSVGGKIPLISSSTTVATTEQSTWISRSYRLIGLGAFPSLLEGSLLEFAPSPSTDEATRAAAREFADALNKESTFVQDSIGLVLPRIICMLANEACFALMEGVAGENDIDTAMRLGTNYPYGPLEWAERIGVRQIQALLSALHEHFGEDRYRTAPLLKRAASLGVFPAR